MRYFYKVDPNTYLELLEQYSSYRPLLAQYPNNTKKLTKYLQYSNVNKAYIQANVLDVTTLLNTITSP